MNSRLISLSNHTPSGLGLDPPQPTPGCSRNDICTPDSCMNDGLCEGLWDKFECTCTETYSGANCSEGELVTILFFKHIPLHCCSKVCFLDLTSFVSFIPCWCLEQSIKNVGITHDTFWSNCLEMKR